MPSFFPRRISGLILEPWCKLHHERRTHLMCFPPVVGSPPPLPGFCDLHVAEPLVEDPRPLLTSTEHLGMCLINCLKWLLVFLPGFISCLFVVPTKPFVFTGFSKLFLGLAINDSFCIIIGKKQTFCLQGFEKETSSFLMIVKKKLFGPDFLPQNISFSSSLGKSKHFAFNALKKKLDDCEKNNFLGQSLSQKIFLFHHHWKKTNILPSSFEKQTSSFLMIVKKHFLGQISFSSSLGKSKHFAFKALKKKLHFYWCLWKKDFLGQSFCHKTFFSLHNWGKAVWGVWHGKTLLDFSWSWKKYWLRVLDDKVSYFLMVVEPWTFFIQFLCRTKKGAPPPPRDWWVW